MRGYLQITFGPMFSGKTSNLIHNIHKFLDVNDARGTPKKGMIMISWFLKVSLQKSVIYFFIIILIILLILTFVL